MRGIALLYCTIYLSGVVLYSTLFIYSSNHDPIVQTAKIFVAGTHCLLLIVPVALAQSRHLVLRVAGFGLITAYFMYALFLVGFFPYFGFVPEIYAFDTGSVRDLSEVADHYFSQLFGWREVALIALFFALLWQIKRTPIPPIGLTIVAVPLLLLGAIFHSFGAPANSEAFGNVTVLRRYGPVVFSYSSVSEWMQRSGKYLAASTEYPGKVKSLTNQTEGPKVPFVSEVPGVSRVIIVQIESFDEIAIDAELSGLPVMPFVSTLRSRCLNYRNFFTMKGAGGSSDAEFTIATGLIPSTRLASLKHVDFSRIETLYDHLQENGVSSSFSHNNHSGFYGRNSAYAQLPALESRFLNPLEPVGESDFATASIKATLESSERSLHYFFNFQSHGPYTGYSDATEQKFSIRRSDDIHVDYLATMSEVDQMIAEVFEVQASGFEKGENMFMLLADHPSGLHTTSDELSRYRVPAMICHNDFDNLEIPNVFGNVDIYPTILEAFGLVPERPFLGESMFWDTRNAVLLPMRKIVYLDETGTPETADCDNTCNAFFDYTEQHIRF